MDIRWDWRLFETLNFDGGAAMDAFMTAVSGVFMWIPLYVLILYIVWRRYSWRGLLVFVVSVAVAMALADMVAGVFKHTGLLKNLWASFPARLRPMWNDMLCDVHVPSFDHGKYGTVSAHAATIAAMATLSIVAIRRWWYAAVIVVVALLICYSRIYLACHYPFDILLGIVLGVLSGGVGAGLFVWCRSLNFFDKKKL